MNDPLDAVLRCRLSYQCFFVTLFAVITGIHCPPSCLYSQDFATQQPAIDHASKKQRLTEQIAEYVRNGSQAYNSGDYVKSVELYSLALDLGHEDASTAYNAACSAALCGQVDRSFRFLNTAVDLGWTRSSHLQKDSDLKPLHQDSRWSKLVAKTTAANESLQTRWNSPAFRSKFAKNLSDSEKAAGLARLWSEIKYNFAHFDQVPDLDWDAVFVETLPKALATQTTLEYYQQLQQMVAKLNDGHTNVYLPRQLASMESSPALITKLIEDKVIIVEIHDPSLISAGLEIGMEITEIDGIDVQKHVAEFVSPFVCASTTQDREQREYGHNLLRGPLNQPVTLTVKTKAGVETKIEVRRQSKMQVRIRQFSTSPCNFEILDGNIGYLQLNSFSSKAITSQFIAQFPNIQKTDSLIIDLRNNGGGNSGYGWEILTYLTKQPVKTLPWHTLQYRPTMRARGLQPVSRHAQGSKPFSRIKETTYDKPVVMLIGPKTYSAAEDMVAIFKQLNRGKTIGQATGGSTGQPLSFDLPGGGRARVCTKHNFFPDGTEFVGFGIQPDIVVDQTVFDVRAGVDTVLQSAIKELTQKNK